MEYQPVSLKLIDDIFTDGEVVDNIALIEVNLIKNLNAPVKVLGSVEMTKKLTIKVQAFSKSAKDSVEKKEVKASEQIEKPKGDENENKKKTATNIQSELF